MKIKFEIEVERADDTRSLEINLLNRLRDIECIFTKLHATKYIVISAAARYEVTETVTRQVEVKL